MREGPATGAWDEAVRKAAEETGFIDTRHIRPGVNSYAVRSPDGRDLIFSIPICIPWDLPARIGLPIRGMDGAVWAVIEHLKAVSQVEHTLAPLSGKGTANPGRYKYLTEPYTLISSPSRVGTSLWHPDEANTADTDCICLVVRGAVPCQSGSKIPPDIPSRLVTAVSEQVLAMPRSPVLQAWITSLDQKIVREMLPSLGLVAFIANGTRPARDLTLNRPFARVAGPKTGVHIPFRCPPGLEPVEVEFPVSGERVSGLGVRQGEYLAITGTNAEGKSTLLQAIIAGQDNHAPGDGRERLVTLPGSAIVEAGSPDLGGADVSLFFRDIPPGLSGSPDGVTGHGSSSLAMAASFQEALHRGSRLLLIDEDRAAANLLVSSSLPSQRVRDLAWILAHDRQVLGGAALVFAGSALGLLIAQADRILLLSDHEAGSISPAEYREDLINSLESAIQFLVNTNLG